jgi:Double-GTPase 2
MFNVTCPFCYHRTNRLYPLFVCSGWHAPGRKACEKHVDPRRRTETNYEDLMYPVFPSRATWIPSPRRAHCPSCGGLTGEHACRECHTPLPAHFGHGVSPVIAIVGARSTGKTVYLTVLANHLQTALRDRFRTSVWLCGDDARHWLETNVKAIFDDGTLPSFTEQGPAGRSEPLVFEWRRRGGRLRHRYESSYLSFLDTAGESLGTQRGVAEMKFLSGVDAFIVVLDPFTLPEARDRLNLPDAAPTAASAYDVLAQVTEVLRNTAGIGGRARNKTPIAVAFAKIDALRGYLGDDHPIFAAETNAPCYDEINGRAIHESVRELLRELGARDIDQFMQANYAKYRYFAVSSLGRPPDYERNKVDESGVMPMRIADPLVWLLSLYGIVPRCARG